MLGELGVGERVYWEAFGGGILEGVGWDRGADAFRLLLGGNRDSWTDCNRCVICQSVRRDIQVDGLD